jgi:hypothetical protein
VGYDARELWIAVRTANFSRLLQNKRAERLRSLFGKCEGNIIFVHGITYGYVEFGGHLMCVEACCGVMNSGLRLVCVTVHWRLAEPNLFFGFSVSDDSPLRVEISQRHDTFKM